MLACLKHFLKQSLRRRGYELYRRPWLPRGLDPWETLHELIPAWQPKLIFDVGANIGDTALDLSRHFPSATIHGFEPVAGTYEIFTQRTHNQSRIHPHRLAFGAKSTRITIQLQAESTLNSLHVSPIATANGHSEEIEVGTLDEFCATQAIRRVDLVKTDTEGHELEVLAGANRMLCEGAIDAVLVEAGLLHGEPRFTPLADLQFALETRGFLLVGIFDQRGWRHRRAADFCDALFVRGKILPP